MSGYYDGQSTFGNAGYNNGDQGSFVNDSLTLVAPVSTSKTLTGIVGATLTDTITYTVPTGGQNPPTPFVFTPLVEGIITITGGSLVQSTSDTAQFTQDLSISLLSVGQTVVQVLEHGVDTTKYSDTLVIVTEAANPTTWG